MNNEESVKRLFTNPVYYEESPLVDRKLEYEWRESWAKTEFIRDVISLANTARLRGKPAYLLLGIDNNGKCIGIDSMLQQMGIDLQKENFKVAELVKSEFQKLISNHIRPPLWLWDFRIILIEQKRCGYLSIDPVTLPQLFSVSKRKKAFKGKKDKSIYQGQSWIRTGESKESLESVGISIEDPEYRYSYAEVPYVLPSVWQRYLQEIQRKLQILMADAPEESAYQELRDNKGVPIQKIVDEFLAQDDEHLLILQGVAGCGKSLFMQRLANELAELGEQEMKDAQRLEQFTPPAGFIPIYYRLRDLTYKARTDSAHFTRILCDLLSPLWEDHVHGQRPKYPEKLFEKPALNWLIVLDGLDEIGQYSRRKAFLKVLVEFMHAYPRLRVILTTRPSPGISLSSIEHARLIEIASLDEKQITDFLMAYRTDNQNEDAIHTFVQQCKTWEDAWRLLGVPAYLNAAALSLGIPRTITDVQEQPPEVPVEVRTVEGDASYASDSQNVEPISQDSLPDASLEVDAPVTAEPTERLEEKRDEEFVKSLPQLLDQIYDAFWEREKKRGIESIKHWRCKTHELAAKAMKNCPEFVKRDRAQRRLREKGLRRVLEMGILSENEHEHIFFTIPSAQIYSAAKQLQSDVEGNFWDDISRYMRRWNETYRASIQSFYEDITGNSLSTIFEGGSNG